MRTTLYSFELDDEFAAPVPDMEPMEFVVVGEHDDTDDADDGGLANEQLVDPLFLYGEWV